MNPRSRFQAAMANATTALTTLAIAYEDLVAGDIVSFREPKEPKTAAFRDHVDAIQEAQANDKGAWFYLKRRRVWITRDQHEHLRRQKRLELFSGYRGCGYFGDTWPEDFHRGWLLGRYRKD